MGYTADILRLLTGLALLRKPGRLAPMAAEVTRIEKNFSGRRSIGNLNRLTTVSLLSRNAAGAKMPRIETLAL